MLAQGFTKCEFVLGHQFGVFLLQKQDGLEEIQNFFATSGCTRKIMNILTLFNF